MILGFRTIFNKQPTGFVDKILWGIKIHTIREDFAGRWKPGRSIQFGIQVRTAGYYQFKSGKCVSVQSIFLNPILGTVQIDGRPLEDSEIKILAHNDGFNSVEEFWNWFNFDDGAREFRLVHWTNFKY